MIFFPNPKADEASYGGAFRLSAREVRWIRTTPAESRSFLIKHDQDSVIARLNLRGMPELIKVLSGRTETVAELDALRARVGDDPQAWLADVLARLPDMPLSRLQEQKVIEVDQRKLTIVDHARLRELSGVC